MPLPIPNGDGFLHTVTMFALAMMMPVNVPETAQLNLPLHGMRMMGLLMFSPSLLGPLQP